MVELNTKVADIFGPSGPLAEAAGAKYEVRPGQIKMAAAIEEVYRDGGVLLVEAPTGTGKSVSYLVPSILQAKRERQKTVVVTANIALQEQLVQKDLPMLQAALGLQFTFALAKGIGNYLCLDRWDDAVAESLLAHRSYDDTAVWDALEQWVGNTTNGDLSTFTQELPPRVRLAVTSTSDDCTGKKCKYYGECYGMRARRQVASADVIVTNYHLFFADLVIKAATEMDGGILPKYDLVVLDEVHAAADIARDFFGWRMTLGAVKWAVRYLPPDKQEPILSVATRFFQSIGVGPGPKGERVKQRITKPGELDGIDLAGLLVAAERQLAAKAELELVKEEQAKIAKCAARCGELAAHLATVTELVQTPDNVRVYYGEPPTNPKGYWALGMKPLNVAKILEHDLFGNEAITAIVGTSATLTAGGSFDFIIRELGCYDTVTLDVPSPFDHTGKAVLVVPTDLPDPKHRIFAERVAEVVGEVVQAANGRTLALFTSYRVLDETYRYLMGLRLPYTIFKQGDRPRTQLITEFRNDIHSVLLGTASFWEGIDVQGEALSAVVIDRLPFDHPDDPVFEAFCEQDPSGWFMHRALPRSVIDFRQGFGRLIRSKTDRGAIVVCDRRIIDKPYGGKYIRSLPKGVELRRNMDAVREILR